jgi:hydroxyacylglutathione hydrolase
LINSIRTHLFTLPSETKVLSGHGPAPEIGEEKINNPYLK